MRRELPVAAGFLEEAYGFGVRHVFERAPGDVLESAQHSVVDALVKELEVRGAMIENGKYQIKASQGLPPGSYHVMISAPDGNGLE